MSFKKMPDQETLSDWSPMKVLPSRRITQCLKPYAGVDAAFLEVPWGK